MPLSVLGDRQTHLYTLIIRPDNTFEILIDNESKKKGSLLTDMDPPVCVLCVCVCVCTRACVRACAREF
jgi:hypothetical protein